MMLDIEANSSTQILSSIKCLALITRKSYLNRVFEKNIVRLLDCKGKKTLSDPDKALGNMKNLDILMMISHGIDFNDSTVISHYKVSKEELVIKLGSDLAT